MSAIENWLGDSSGGAGHFILTVLLYGRFEGSPKTFYWYHVPRVGDFVDDPNPDGRDAFEVESVRWKDHRVEVWLK